MKFFRTKKEEPAPKFANKTQEFQRTHFFPESPLHHLSNCWCDAAKKYRETHL